MLMDYPGCVKLPRVVPPIEATLDIQSNEIDDTIIEDVSNQGRMIDELDRDEGVALICEKEEEKKAEEVKDIAGDEQVKGRQAEMY
nr:hypothetical protein [Tanacetum cinerariifolium]